MATAQMTSKTNKFVKAASVITALSSMVVAGIGIYRAVRDLQHNRKVEEKLDNRLDDSMDCSDATAKY